MPGLPVTMPRVPGGDVAGVVHAVGPGVEAHWVGRRVVVDPHIGGGGALGEHANGGLCERLAVDAANLIAMPDAVSFDQAAALPIAVWHRLAHADHPGPGAGGRARADPRGQRRRGDGVRPDREEPRGRGDRVREQRREAAPAPGAGRRPRRGLHEGGLLAPGLGDLRPPGRRGRRQLHRRRHLGPEPPGAGPPRAGSSPAAPPPASTRARTSATSGGARSPSSAATAGPARTWRRSSSRSSAGASSRSSTASSRWSRPPRPCASWRTARSSARSSSDHTRQEAHTP